MLDTFTSKLLNYLYSQNSNGDFRILSINEIMANLRIKENDNAKLNNSLSYLKEKEYIKIKYLDEEEICYCLLTNANIFIENNNFNKVSKSKSAGKYLLKLILLFLSAFLGAFSAVMIIHFFF